MINQADSPAGNEFSEVLMMVHKSIDAFYGKKLLEGQNVWLSRNLGLDTLSWNLSQVTG